MWLLIIVTTFYAHGEGEPHKPSVYQFHEFATKGRCETVKNWVEKREYGRIKAKLTTVECVKND